MESLFGTTSTNKQQQQQQQLQQQLQQLQQQQKQQQQQLMQPSSIMDPKLGSTTTGNNPHNSIVGGGSNPLSSIGNNIANIKQHQQKLMSSSYTNQLIKTDGGSSMFMTADDGAIIKNIQETHAPDGREVDVKPLLYLVEDILSAATVRTESALLPVLGQTHFTDHDVLVEDRANNVGVVAMLDALSFLIDRISCEIACKCLSGSDDAHGTTVSIFNLLSSYTWDAKLVLTLAAFALHYGEFRLLAQIYSSNPLAKSMAILRQMSVIIEHFNSLKPRFDALTNLINVMLEVARCIVDLKELPSSYISQDVSELNAMKAFVPTAVYWTIRSVVACATQIHTLSSMGQEYKVSTTETWELSTLAHKLNNILEQIKKLLRFCNQLIDTKKEEEYVVMLQNVFKIQHIDNMQALKLLIYAKDDIQPLVYGSTKKRVSMDVLRRKNVLLLISGLDISQDELEILEKIYNESRLHLERLESTFEVLWIPIVDPSIEWNNNMQTQFESLQSKMPWYWVHHAKLIERASIRFIREEWQFSNKAILVALDPQGKVVSPNAVHMMWIWGSTAFPFTTMKEISLWQEESYRLELLIDGIDQTILNWIKDGKYIILYGGDDIEWIRRFTAAARTLASVQRIQLEMAYVGRSGKKEQQLRKVLSVINNENLSYCWNNHSLIWFFWTRLESMFFSKIQLKQADEQDPMTQEIKKLLNYDKSSGRWAVLSRGSSVILTGHGSTVLDTLLELGLSKECVSCRSFDGAILGHHKHKIGECPECNRPLLS